jgi:two-component system invasion response regulator UvrY
MIQVMIVDDHELVRIAIARLLSDFSDIQVVSQVGSGEVAIKVAKEKKPDVILMDINMPGIGGIKAAQKILVNHPNIKIIALTAYTNEPFPASFLKAGAKGYLTKGTDPENMVKAIRDVAIGKNYLEPAVAEQLALKNFSGSHISPMDVLSNRELDVMMMVIKGIQVQTIAETLCVSPKTVNSYRYRLYEKLNVQNDVELTLFAMRHSMLDRE